MAIKFQYNKTSLGELGKQLKIRQKALPTIKSKESALRVEVKRAKSLAQSSSREMEQLRARMAYMVSLWGEFDETLLSVRDLDLEVRKIAGVRIPFVRSVVFEEKPFDIFSSPAWYADGIAMLKELATVGIQSAVYTRQMELLDYARRKTTQKVNLYEKVQIPGYESAILKIKRFMEDEENLSKSAQKIVKTRQMAAAKKTES